VGVDGVLDALGHRVGVVEVTLRSSANSSAVPLISVSARTAHAVAGEGAQVDVAAPVAPGDVVVDAHPYGAGVVEVVDALGVVAHLVEPGTQSRPR